MSQYEKIKVLVILGPTATGKSDLAVRLAKEFSGEVISADSRQVYKGLDIGTGKITPTEMQGVRHHLLDVVETGERFGVNQWKELAEKAAIEIHSRGKLPIICGGTGFYISALVDNLNFPEVKSDREEQKKLESKTSEELLQELEKLDLRRAKMMQVNGEATNKRRLARAIIVARELGEVPPLNVNQDSHKLFDAIQIGITLSDEELKKRIHDRLVKRLDAGMIEEAQNLHKEGLSYERMDELGLEYRYLAQLLQGMLTKEQLIPTLDTKIWQYAKRQKTWFKRDGRIVWFSPTELIDIKNLVKNWIEKPRS